MAPAIRVENLSKRYRIGTRTHPANRNLTEALVAAARGLWRGLAGGGRAAGGGDGTFWALKGVSFEVQPGEVVGIIGRNGAGKSTLLKVLSRIVEPTGGRCEVRGRMGSLLEVGTGFHPELTGRENVYLNGSVLGMSRREIARKFDEIVAFSEIEKFIDTPVKRYSSGMYVRLAFAVAAHLEPEILLVDEVLAVGDAAFQKKCLGTMEAVGRGGRTVLFVSHQLTVIQRICTKAVYLKSGVVDQTGEPTEVLARYHQDLSGKHCSADVDLANHLGRTPGSVPALRRVRVMNAQDERPGRIPMGGAVRIELEFEAEGELTDVVCGIVVKNSIHGPVFGVNNLMFPSRPLAEPGRAGRVTCWLEDLPLMPGDYRLDLYFGHRGRDTDVIHDAIELTVEPTDVFGSGRLPGGETGPVYWPARWELVRLS